MDATLAIIAGLLMIVGIIGCVLPVLPGPPISYVGLILLHFTDYADFSNRVLWVLGIVTIIVTVLDYTMPVRLTKRLGGTQAGIRGSTIGLIIGFFIPPQPLFIILGPMIGAFIAEMMHNNNRDIAVRSAVGSFIGFLLATGLKLTSSLIMAYYFGNALLS